MFSLALGYKGYYDKSGKVWLKEDRNFIISV